MWCSVAVVVQLCVTWFIGGSVIWVGMVPMRFRCVWPSVVVQLHVACFIGRLVLAQLWFRCVCGMVHMWFSGVWLSVAGCGSVMCDMVQKWSAALVVQLQRQQQNHLQ